MKTIFFRISRTIWTPLILLCLWLTASGCDPGEITPTIVTEGIENAFDNENSTPTVDIGSACATPDVTCADGLQCVSHYDGTKFFCKIPCSANSDCPAGEVCEAAPQISETLAEDASMVCKKHCTSLAGSGCGYDLAEPHAIVKWEVVEVAEAYNLRGINSQGEAYLDATIDWYGDEIFSITFLSPAFCQVTMNIAEAVIYENSCEGADAEEIGTVGLDLFTDMEDQLAAAKKDADGSFGWASKACPWVIGGLGTVSAAFFGVGALYGLEMAAGIASVGVGTAIGVAGFSGGIAAAIPAAILGVTAGGCWLHGKLQDPPLSNCVADCSFGNSPCFDSCIDDELETSTLSTSILLPQCVLACETDDDNCLTSCSYLLL